MSVILGTPQISIDLTTTHWLIICLIIATGMAIHYRTKWLQAQGNIEELEDQINKD